jgi:methionyl-tRNA formyltransferase
MGMAGRVVFCGMFGPLSRLPLAALHDAGIAVAAVVVPQMEGEWAGAVRRLEPPPGWPGGTLSLAARLRQTTVEFAWERDIPVLEVARLADEEVLAALADYTPEVIAVSCFPHRFPSRLLALPRGGVLNLHPSPLPRGRGPDPLVWHFREPDGAGAGGGGATVHLMDRGLDSGPIVLQERFALPDGTTGPELELRAASLGAGLLARAVGAILAGEADPRPQDDADATTYPMPVEDDFVVTPDRPARWAFNFLRGTAGRGFAHRLVIGDDSWLVRAARGYDPAATLPTPYVESGDELRVRCAPGVLAVTTYGART